MPNFLNFLINWTSQKVFQYREDEFLLSLEAVEEFNLTELPAVNRTYHRFSSFSHYITFLSWRNLEKVEKLWLAYGWLLLASLLPSYASRGIKGNAVPSWEAKLDNNFNLISNHFPHFPFGGESWLGKNTGWIYSILPATFQGLMMMNYFPPVFFRDQYYARNFSSTSVAGRMRK